MSNYENNNTIDLNHDEYSKPMTIKDWLITYLLMLIPIANIVLVFIWAFGSNVNKSKKTYFQASLIMMGIVILLYIVFGIIIFSLLANNSVRY